MTRALPFPVIFILAKDRFGEGGDWQATFPTSGGEGRNNGSCWRRQRREDDLAREGPGRGVSANDGGLTGACREGKAPAGALAEWEGGAPWCAAISRDAVKRKFRTFYRESEFDSPRFSHQWSFVGKRPERSSGNSAFGLKYLKMFFTRWALLILLRSPCWLSTVNNAASVGCRLVLLPLCFTLVNSCANLVYNKLGSDWDAEMKNLPFLSWTLPSRDLCRQSPKSWHSSQRRPQFWPCTQWGKSQALWKKNGIFGGEKKVFKSGERHIAEVLNLSNLGPDSASVFFLENNSVP